MRASSRRLFAVFDGHRYGYADDRGAIVIAHRFTKIATWGAERFFEDLAVAFERGKAGFIRPDGEWAIEARWSDARPFSDGRARVATYSRRSARFRYVDREGRAIGPERGWARAEDVVSGRAFVQAELGGPAVLIDRDGEVVAGDGFLDGGVFSEGLAAAKDATGRWGYVDLDGRWVIAPRYRFAAPFSEGLGCVQTEANEVLFVDRDGVERCRFPIPYLELQSFSEGLVRMPDRVDSLSKAYHDREGTVRIPAARGNLGAFSFGRALHLAGGYGFIDPTGALVIEPRYALAEAFRDGLARVVPDAAAPGRWIYVDREGRTVIEARP